MASAEHHLPGEGAPDVVGVRLGLAIVAGSGFLLGALTCGGLWCCYPPAHGAAWPTPAIGVGSAVLLVWGYVQLRRRIGPLVADCFVLGYVAALLVVVGTMMGDEVVDFIHGQIELFQS